MIRALLTFAAALFLTASPAPANAQELPDGQSEADYRAWLGNHSGLQASILSFESWQEAAGVGGVLPTWQIVRTASMWRECGGPPFQVPPPQHWPGMARTLRFIRDHIRPALGEVEAVSGYRNEALNACARGSVNSAHRDYFALDLVPVRQVERRELFRILCSVHARHGAAAGAGLGFYSFQRFHIDTRSFRRWGSAGPGGNESPCALIERGEDPLAVPVPAPAAAPAAPPVAPSEPVPAPRMQPAPVAQAQPSDTRHAVLQPVP